MKNVTNGKKHATWGNQLSRQNLMAIKGGSAQRNALDCIHHCDNIVAYCFQATGGDLTSALACAGTCGRICRD